MSKQEENKFSSLRKSENKDSSLNEIITRKVDSPIFSSLKDPKSFIRRHYEKTILFYEIFKHNKKNVYDPLFFWSNCESIQKTIDGKYLVLELNFKVPDDSSVFPIPRERQILYSRYLMKELLLHAHYAMDFYYNLTPEYRKFMLVRESKKHFFDPLITIMGLCFFRKLVHIIWFRKFVKKNLLAPILYYISMCTLSVIQRYLEYVAHYNFISKEILQQHDLVPIEKEYQDYLIYKNQLYLYEKDRVNKTGTIHPIEINNEKNLIIKSIKPKPLL